MIWLSGAYLGRGVAGRAAGGFEFLVGGVEVAQAEVDELDASFPVDQDVGGLDVAVRAAELVEVADRLHQLLEELAGLFLREPLPALDVLAQLALLGELHDEEEVVLRLDDFVELDYVLVAHL